MEAAGGRPYGQVTIPSRKSLPLEGKVAARRADGRGERLTPFNQAGWKAKAGSKSLPLEGGAPRSESKSNMIAGGNHTLICEGAPVRTLGRKRWKAAPFNRAGWKDGSWVHLISQFANGKLTASPQGEAIVPGNDTEHKKSGDDYCRTVHAVGPGPARALPA